MTPQELKASILQLAIQGKLVEQRHEEGTGAELLRDILTQRRRGAECAEKNSRAETPRRRGKADAASSREEIPDSEKPFDIPESWVWVRIGELGASTDTDSFCDGPFGSNLKTSHHISYPEVRIIQLSNIGEDGWKDKNVKYTSFRHLETVIPRCEVHPGDFVIAKMMPAGRTIQVPELGTRITLGSDAMKFVPHPMLNKQFLLYAMRSQVFLGQVYAEAHGITRVRTTLNSVKSYVLPLPPLAEQKRIVAKIEELLPLIDRYEKAWNKLEDFNRRFPGDMQKSLLQMAIQGKLVDQHPEEGTGEELYRRLKPYHKGLKPCKEELDYSSMDFDVPTNWTMIELNQLFDFVDYRGKTPNKTTSGVFLITASNIRQAYMDYTRKEYISREEYKGRQSRGLTQKGDLLFTTEAPMGNAALCDLDECSCGQRIITFKEYAKGTAYPPLYMYFILSPQFQQQLLDNCTGTTAKGIKADKLKHFLIPLPPLAEQRRIVAKLEELLPLCERLK